jgi:hypothetical protein
MNEQKINVCRALASIFTSKDEVSDEEAAFVGRTALDLGLDEGELKLVQQALAAELDTKELLRSVTDEGLRRFLFRRVVAATLIDAELSENEKQIVDTMATIYEWKKDVVEEYLGYMKGFIEMERKGEEIISRLR